MHASATLSCFILQIFTNLCALTQTAEQQTVGTLSELPISTDCHGEGYGQWTLTFGVL